VFEESTASCTDEQKSEWVLNGNVPMGYKVRDNEYSIISTTHVLTFSFVRTYIETRWVDNQRFKESNDKLKPCRKDQLTMAGFKWSGEIYEET
jgi:hypothetical protein